MAAVTQIGGVDMSNALAAGLYAVVTGNALIRREACVVNGCGYPLLCAMAGITFRSCCNVRWTFAGCNDVVMTAGAHSNNLVVIHCTVGYRYPGRWMHQVTGVTHVGGIDMCCTFT